MIILPQILLVTDGAIDVGVDTLSVKVNRCMVLNKGLFAGRIWAIDLKLFAIFVKVFQKLIIGYFVLRPFAILNRTPLEDSLIEKLSEYFTHFLCLIHRLFTAWTHLNCLLIEPLLDIFSAK